jgi:UDP-GlcNAc:undecaprenyl-phosphate GlcNAc-1-phosphate transferase
LLFLSLFIGIVLIVITTKLTQALKISSIWMLLGQISASLVIIMVGKLDVSYFNLIYGNQIELGYLTIPFSLLFIVGFTNVINIEKVQNHLILLLPCVSLVCLSILALIMGNSFVSITGICASLTIMSILLYGYYSGKVFVGRTHTTSIGFIIAVLSLVLKTVYIPIFTLALPFGLYYLIQNKFKIIQSITISSLVAILFSVLMFVVPYNILWYLVVGLTVILVITQLFRRYRFI